MKRPAKAIIFGTLLAAALSGLMYMNIGARYPQGGHGYRGYHRPKRSHRHRGGLGLRKPVAIIPVESIEKYSWKDSAGEMFWKITNNTLKNIRVSSDEKTINIPSRHSANLPRNSSFVLTVETGKQTRSFQTNNHFVEFYLGKKLISPSRERKIKIRSHIEWPGGV